MSDLSVISFAANSHPVQTGLLVSSKRNASTSNILNQKHGFMYKN